jgi:methylated-DNA-[protein]-cysteine S-methyltransferase
MDYYHDFIETPLGIIKIESSKIGIIGLTKSNVKSASNSNDIIEAAKRQLTAYFNGELKQFELPLDFEDASDFYISVWNELLKIPFGATTNYQTIANKINNPKSVRAVGMANGKNKIPIIVPCHRVIGSDGSLTGFAWGLEAKSKLLSIENPQTFGIQQKLFA